MKKSTQTKKVNQASRVAFLFGIAFLITLIYIGRLLYLQVFSVDKYRKSAISQRRSVTEIVPKRGLIFDRNKNPLAMSVMVNTCYLFPEDAKKEANIIETLSYILGLEPSVIKDALGSKEYAVMLKTQLSQEEVEKLNKSGLGCISIEQESSRLYPKGPILGQTLGFTNWEGVGVYGIESFYDDILRGESGQEVISIDTHGYKIPFDAESRINEKAGENILLTIDSNFQKIVYEELKKAWNTYQPERVSVILMDPNNGEILAMDSFPNYDPNNPSKIIDQNLLASFEKIDDKEKEKLRETLWDNPCVSELYEPGSVFKTLTTAISLETKSSKPGEMYKCTGTIDIDEGVSINCVIYPGSHGDQTLEEAFVNSCNPAYVQIVNEIGKEKFFSYLKALNFPGRTGVDLPAEEDSLYKDSTKDISPAQFSTSAYGHGISVTPLQMISAVNAVINGGYYYKPHIFSKILTNDGEVVKEYEANEPNQVFSKETSDIMIEYLKNVVIGNNASVGKIDGLIVGGKTGTTTKLVDGEYYDDILIRSYWSFFPADNPKYSLMVVIDNPKLHAYDGESEAGVIAANIIDRMMTKKTSEGFTSQTSSIAVPDLTGKTVKEAEEILKAQGLKLSVYGDMESQVIIGKQSPNAKELVPYGDSIKVSPEEVKRVKVIDFTGLNREEISKVIEDTGINVRTDGSGVVKSQSIKAGEIIDASESIVLTLE